MNGTIFATIRKSGAAPRSLAPRCSRSNMPGLRLRENIQLYVGVKSEIDLVFPAAVRNAHRLILTEHILIALSGSLLC